MIKLIHSTFFNEKDMKAKLCSFIEKANKLSFGTQCVEFENKFAEWQGRKYAIFFNSGSSANLALLRALLNIKLIEKGDNIAFSSLTWATNVMPIIELGMTAVPVDVELETLNVSSKIFIKVLESTKIKVLFITNLLGFCSDLNEIKRICKKKNILLLEDNCESLGSVYKGIKLGNFGLASTFSFFVGHHMSTIEGGMVCTDDKELADMLRLVRAHGWDRALDKETRDEMTCEVDTNSFYAKYTFYDLAYNFRPSEINGFIGLTQMQYLDEIIFRREKNFKKIAISLYGKDTPYFPIKFDHMDVVSCFAIPVICKTKKIQESLIRKCDGLVEIRPIVGGDITQQPFFKKYIDGAPSQSNAAIIHNQGLYFSNDAELKEDDVVNLKTIFTKVKQK